MFGRRLVPQSVGRLVCALVLSVAPILSIPTVALSADPGSAPPPTAPGGHDRPIPGSSPAGPAGVLGIAGLGPSVAVPPSATFYAAAFGVRVLSPAQLPYADGTIPSGPPHSAYHDAAGIPEQLFDGKLVYKPAGLAQLGLAYVEAYRRTANPMHLTWARAIAFKLDSLAVSVGSARYLPYRMTFPMHGDPRDLMRDPWYSGMAQGLELSLLVRLGEVTGDAGYLTRAVPYWNSIRNVRTASGPWVSWVSKHYLWIEEYPQADPEHTLNGFMFATFGVYDYWRVTRSTDALYYLRGALTTLRAYAPRYRNPGGAADYCLKHGKPQPKYHGVVTGQLREMALISGDASFTRLADLFAKDYAYHS